MIIFLNLMFSPVKKICLGLALGLFVVACGGNIQEGANQETNTTDNDLTTSGEADATAATEMSPALAQKMSLGDSVYSQYCVACHQSDGRGVTGAFPTLHQTEWVQGEKLALVSIIINGMQGPIVVKGEEYNNVMPQHGFLSNEEVAAVLTYVRNSFGNNASEVTVEDVKDIRNRLELEKEGQTQGS